MIKVYGPACERLGYRNDTDPWRDCVLRLATKDSLETDALKGYEGMEARAGWDRGFPELLMNHDWNYAVFGPDKSVRNEVNQAICLSCHIPAAHKDYVFTLDHIQDKAKGK